jgi:Bacterial protein of unknown function (DUF899)
MGWSFPWASSFDSDFNYDLHVAHSQEEWQSGAVEYNFRSIDMRPELEAGKENPVLAEIASSVGTDWETYRREGPGVSALALEDGVVYHTYSAYARGLDGLWGMYSGSTARHSVATRPASGGAATTSTTASDAGGKLPVVARCASASCGFEGSCDEFPRRRGSYFVSPVASDPTMSRLVRERS